MTIVTDRVADVFTRIRNAQRRRFDFCRMMRTKETVAVLKVLLDEGYISGFRTLGEEPRQEVQVFLKYDDMNCGVIRTIRRISKPSRRISVCIRDLPPSHSGLGRWILKTSEGIMSDATARRRKIGGEVLGEVF
mmetsp:Transcript_1583/g.2837  ORF Transcript_1583/g.2837 Transcript_1583/m.2837 type:complete len:134 (-) Transcript_1583:1288-1689(-)